MRYQFLPEADEEFREAARYYESEAPGVGIAFIVEVHRAISEMVTHPGSAPVVRRGIRKKVLNHFPYSVLYSTKSDLIMIVAVAHHKRRPAYWRGRHT